MRVVALDPGVVHVGIAVFDIDADAPFGEVRVCDMVNLMRYGQSRHITDRTNGWLDSECAAAAGLRSADVIVMEIQPFGGAGETFAALVYNRFGSKVVWVSPNRLHRTLKISHLDYDGRKEWMVEYAREHACLHCAESWGRHQRQHDMADAIALGLYHIRKHIACPNRFAEFSCGKRSRFFSC